MKPRHALYIFVSTCALAVAACQPAEGLDQRADGSLGRGADQVAHQVDRAADQARDKGY